MADASSNPNILLEGDTPGLPLIISFGFYAANNDPQFDFYGRLKKVALVSGRAMNRLYLRDPQQLWYLQGVEGIGDVDETVTHLRTIIEKLSPSFTATIGQSMGAYAAILYGTLLGVDKVLAFGPLSCFERERWSLMGERRWQAILTNLTQRGGPTKPLYADLASVVENHVGKRPTIDLLYGMAPDENNISTASIGHDVAHAMRFEGLANVTLLPIPGSPHAIVEYFRRNGIITDVIMHLLFGTDVTARIEALHAQEPQEWMAWVIENIARGVQPSTLAETMRQQHMDETLIRNLLERADVMQALRSIAARTAPVRELAKAPYNPEDDEELHCECSNPAHQHR